MWCLSIIEPIFAIAILYSPPLHIWSFEPDDQSLFTILGDTLVISNEGQMYHVIVHSRS